MSRKSSQTSVQSCMDLLSFCVISLEPWAWCCSLTAQESRKERQTERNRERERLRDRQTEREKDNDSIGGRGWWLPWGAVGGWRRVRDSDVGREGAMWGAMWVEVEKSGQQLQGEGLERSIVCSVHEETGQGVRLRNSLQWLSQPHVAHHVLLPSFLLSLSCPLPYPLLPASRFVWVFHILSVFHPLSVSRSISLLISPLIFWFVLSICLPIDLSVHQSLSLSLVSAL